MIKEVKILEAVDVSVAIKKCLWEYKENIFKFDVSDVPGAGINFNWALCEVDCVTKVFTGMRMRNLHAFACELYAVLQLGYSASSNLDVIWDLIYEFDHWVVGGTYVFIFTQTDLIMSENLEGKTKALEVMTDYIELINGPDHFPDRKAILIFID